MLHASKCYQEVHIDLIVRDYEYAQVTRSAQGQHKHLCGSTCDLTPRPHLLKIQEYQHQHKRDASRHLNARLELVSPILSNRYTDSLQQPMLLGCWHISYLHI